MPFSHYIEPVFEYDAQKGCYLRSQYGAPYVDETTGQQIEVDNLFIVFAEHRAVGDEAGHIEVVTTGSGQGLYFSKGAGCAVNWSKQGDTDFFTFTDEAGQELEVNRGRMWICVVAPNCKVSYTDPAQQTDTQEPGRRGDGQCLSGRGLRRCRPAAAVVQGACAPPALAGQPHALRRFGQRNHAAADAGGGGAALF